MASITHDNNEAAQLNMILLKDSPKENSLVMPVQTFAVAKSKQQLKLKWADNFVRYCIKEFSVRHPREMGKIAFK